MMPSESQRDNFSELEKKWRKREKMKILHIDGGCSGNGQKDLSKREMVSVVTDDSGNVLREVFNGGGSNNIAEFIALKEAIDWALENKHKQICIYTDSKNNIRWHKRLKKAKQNDYEQVKVIKDEIDKMERYIEVDLSWRSRKDNLAGHYIENKKIDIITSMRSETVTARVDPETLQKIDKLAKADNRTRSYVVLELILTALVTKSAKPIKAVPICTLKQYGENVLEEIVKQYQDRHGLEYFEAFTKVSKESFPYRQIYSLLADAYPIENLDYSSSKINKSQLSAISQIKVEIDRIMVEAD